MPKNNIEELRNNLFDTLRSLKGEVQPIDLQRAKAICDVAGKIIDTGKLEVSAMRKVAGNQESDPRTEFFGERASRSLNQPPKRPQLTNGKARTA